MEAASFYGRVHHKRYSGQQELLHKKHLKESETSGVWIKKCNFALQFIKV